MAGAAPTELHAAADKAGRQLDADLARIAERGSAGGDPPTRFVCGMALSREMVMEAIQQALVSACMADGLLTVWLPPHAPAAAAIAARATVWKTLGCKG